MLGDLPFISHITATNVTTNENSEAAIIEEGIAKIMMTGFSWKNQFGNLISNTL